MKQTKYYYLLACFFLILVGHSCVKEEIDKFDAYEEKWESIDMFTKQVKSFKAFTINKASEGFAIETEQAVYVFPENALQDKNGKIIQGAVRIEVSEFKQAGKQIMEQVHSTALPNEVIYPQYMGSLRFTAKGQGANLAKPYDMYVKTSNQNLVQQSEFEWMDTGDQAGWFPVNSPTIESKSWDFELQNKQYTGKGLKVERSDLNRFCIAAFENLIFDKEDDFTSIDINISSLTDSKETKIYLVNTETNSTIALQALSSTISYDKIKKGTNYKILMLGTQNDVLYFGKTSFNIQNKETFNITTKAVNYVELLNELRKL